jgi:arsenite methyltransferase
MSHYTINLTDDKASVFKEIHRILKDDGRGRMYVSDLVTDRDQDKNLLKQAELSIAIQNGALTKENYLQSIRTAGFKNVMVLEDEAEFKKAGSIFSRLVVKAVKD